MTSSDERQFDQEKIKAQKRRLHLLELRIARQGADVDPAVEMEAEDLRLNIETAEAAISQPRLTRLTRDIIRDRYEDDIEFLIVQMASLARRLASVELRLDADDVKRDMRQQWTDQQFRRIFRAAQVGLFIIGIMGVFVVARWL